MSETLKNAIAGLVEAAESDQSVKLVMLGFRAGYDARKHSEEVRSGERQEAADDNCGSAE